MPPKSTRASSRPATREVTPTEGWNPSRLRSGSQARTTPGRTTPAPAPARQVSATPTPSNVSQASKRPNPPVALTARIGGTSHAYGRGPRQVASNVAATAKQASFGSALEEALGEAVQAKPSTQTAVPANEQEVEEPIPIRTSAQLSSRDRISKEGPRPSRGPSVLPTVRSLVSGTRELSRTKGNSIPLTRTTLQISNKNEIVHTLDDSIITSKSHDETFRNEHEAGLANAVGDRLAAIRPPATIQSPIQSVQPESPVPHWYRVLKRWFRVAFTPARHVRAEHLDNEGVRFFVDFALMLLGYVLVLIPMLMALLWSVPWAQAYVESVTVVIVRAAKYGYCGISEHLCDGSAVDLSNRTMDGHMFRDVLAKMSRADIKLRNLENALENREPDRVIVQQVNYFSPSIGAKVLQHLTSPTMPTAAEGRPGLFRQLFFSYGQLPAINALTPWTEAGQAWCAAASDTGLGLAQLGVRTAYTVMANSVTIEHVPEAATLDIKTAPKELEVWGKAEAGYGALDTFDHICDTDPPGADFICLGKIKYDIKKRNHVQTSALINKNVPASTFVIRVVANHGRHYSCLYRVQLHGDVAKMMS
jgi:hypothetical protein